MCWHNGTLDSSTKRLVPVICMHIWLVCGSTPVFVLQTTLWKCVLKSVDYMENNQEWPPRASTRERPPHDGDCFLVIFIKIIHWFRLCSKTIVKRSTLAFSPSALAMQPVWYLAWGISRRGYTKNISNNYCSLHTEASIFAMHTNTCSFTVYL